MVGKKILKALNEQLKWEMYSANLYLSMSGYFQNQGLPGFANWMRVQYQEETAHALKFYDFILTRGGEIDMAAIDAPPKNWKDALGVFKMTAEHEAEVTDRINNLAHLSHEERDYATEIFLQWFVTEQVEEEEAVKDIMNQLKLIKGEGQGMLLLDKDFATRVFVPPPPAAN
ncbi:MAG: ferritin [Akkermansia sp.]